MRKRQTTFLSALTLLAVLLLAACGGGNKVTELEAQVNSLVADLEAAQTSLNASQERIAELEALATEVPDGAEAVSSDALSELQTSLDEALTAQETMAADLEANQTALEETQAALEEAEARIAELETDLDAALEANTTEAGAETTADEAAEDVAEATNDAVDTVTDTANDVSETATEGANNVASAVGAAAAGAAAAVGEAASNAADAVSGAASEAADAVSGALAGASEGGTVTVAITAEPPGWDPSASTSQEIARVMYHNVFEGLVRFNQSGEIVPALAESWATSDDGLTWTFKLREGVKFHDGSELSTDDVIAKFERAKDPESGHTHPEYYEAIDSISADGQDVIFTLSEPSSSLLYNLARPDSVIYPAAKADTQATEPVGTGPFIFADYTEGSEVRLERFEDYYIAGVPLLDEVVFRIIEDPNTRFAALQAGDIDLIGTSLAPEQYQQLEGLDGVKGAAGSATTEITLALNNTNEALSDIRVRQAITHAIDKQAIVDGAMFGLGTVIGTHMSPSEPYYIDLSDTYPYDPEKAKELLAEAGYGDGLSLRFELPEPYNIERRAGQVIAQQLAEVGIDVDLSVVEWATWIERIFLGGDYDMTIIGHSEPRDINVYGNPDYYYHYDNPEIAEKLAEIEQTSDEGEQTELFQDIARTIAEDAVNVWVFSPPYLVAASDDLEGFWTNQPTPSIDMTEVYRSN